MQTEHKSEWLWINTTWNTFLSTLQSTVRKSGMNAVLDYWQLTSKSTSAGKSLYSKASFSFSFFVSQAFSSLSSYTVATTQQSSTTFATIASRRHPWMSVFITVIPPPPLSYHSNSATGASKPEFAFKLCCMLNSKLFPLNRPAKWPANWPAREGQS